MKRSGRRITTKVGVPLVINTESADSGVHLLTVAKGVKFAEFFKHNDPDTYRIVSETVGKLWLREAMFGSGFFHMDLHPGNILAARNADGSIELTLLDFGMTDMLSADHRGAFMRLNAAVRENNADKIAAAFRVLLKKPVDPDQLKAAVERAMARPNYTVNMLCEEITRIHGELPESFVRFSRGVSLVAQTLVQSGSKETVNSLISQLTSEQLIKEVPGRVAQAVLGRNDERPQTGMPLTNRELGGIIRAEASLQCGILLKKYGRKPAHSSSQSGP